MIPAEEAQDFRLRLPVAPSAGLEGFSFAGSLAISRPPAFVPDSPGAPIFDAERYRLVLDGEVERALDLSLLDLRERFARYRLTTTGPNSRTATWLGVRLASVLAAARPTTRARHVELIGHDASPTKARGWHFAASIPLAQALTPDVLLAWERNGEPLAPVDGAPLRLVRTGHLGAWNVKWLQDIRLRR